MGNTSIETPYYVVEEKLLRENLEKLKYVIDRTGCKILLAQKAFSMFSVYPIISEYLDGTTASSLFEAKLGKEQFGKETHIYNPAYDPRDFPEIVAISDHIVFNSVEQWQRFRPQV